MLPPEAQLAVGRARALREAIHSKHFRKEAILSSVCAIQPERRHRHRPSQNKCRMIEHHAVHDGRRVSPAVSCVSDPYLFNLAATLVRPVQVPVEEERPSVLEEPQQLSAAFEHARQVPSFDVHRLAHYLERPLHVVKASMFSRARRVSLLPGAMDCVNLSVERRADIGNRAIAQPNGRQRSSVASTARQRRHVGGALRVSAFRCRIRAARHTPIARAGHHVTLVQRGSRPV